MKKIKKIILIILLIVFPFCLVSCQKEDQSRSNENQPTRYEVELNENNYWKYINVKETISNKDTNYEINGVLTYAFYEDVVFAFDVFYYIDGQPEEEYNKYTMLIGCNAAGNANFVTYSSGITSVTVGKWLGVNNGELVYLENYNWKIHFNSVSGKVIYTI